MPTGWPCVTARASNRPAVTSSQPNFWPSAQSAPAPLVVIRTSSVAPGARSISLSSSASQSTENRRTPRAWAWAMSTGFFTVLP